MASPMRDESHRANEFGKNERGSGRESRLTERKEDQFPGIEC